MVEGKAGSERMRQGLGGGGGTLINPRTVFEKTHGQEVLHLGTEPRIVWLE